MLGCEPTKAWAKGHVQHFKSGRQIVRKTGAWFLDFPITTGVTFNEQVVELFAKLTNDLSTWQQLNQRYTVDLFCGWFMSTTNDGESISVDSLRTLASRGVEVGLDIYGADEEEKQ